MEDRDKIDVDCGPEPEYARLTQHGLEQIRKEDEAAARIVSQAGAQAPITPPPVVLTPEQKAECIHNNMGAVYLGGAAGSQFGPMMGFPDFKAYLDRFLKDAGSPSDPLQRLMLEQVLMAHHAIGRLHFRAGNTKDLREVSACLTAAARLMSEFRRHELSLQDRRGAEKKQAAEERPRPFTSAHVRFPKAGKAPHLCGSVKAGDTKLVSNEFGVFPRVHKPEPVGA